MTLESADIADKCEPLIRGLTYREDSTSSVASAARDEGRPSKGEAKSAPGLAAQSIRDRAQAS